MAAPALCAVFLAFLPLRSPAQTDNLDPNPANITVISGAAGFRTGDSNSGFTSQAGEPAHRGIGPFNSAWYRWTPVNGTVTFAVTNANFEPVVSVYTTNDIPPGLPSGTPVWTNVVLTPYSTVPGPTGVNALYRFTASTLPAGNAYFIVVASRFGFGGTYDLRWGQPPANDNLLSASSGINLTPASGGTVSGDNFGATRQAGEPNHGSVNTYATSPTTMNGASLWYRWDAPADGVLQLIATGTDAGMDPAIGVYKQGPGTPIAATLIRVAETNALGGANATLSFYATAGTRYFIAVDGNNSPLLGVAQGPFNLQWAFTATPPGPPVFPVGTAGHFQFTSARATNSVEGVTVTDYNVSELDNVATITVTRTGGATGRMVVHYRTIDPPDFRSGSAANGSNYTGKDSRTGAGGAVPLIFDEYQMSASFDVSVFQAGPTNTNTTVTVELLSAEPFTSAVRAALASGPYPGGFTSRVATMEVESDSVAAQIFPPTVSAANATLTIRDTQQGVVLVNGARTLFEDAGTTRGYTFTLLRNGVAPGNVVTVDWRINDNDTALDNGNTDNENNTFPLSAGSDYAKPNEDYATPHSGTVTFPAGNPNNQNFTINIADDTLLEFNEDFSIELVNLRIDGGTPPANALRGLNRICLVTILDDGDDEQASGAMDRYYNRDGVAGTSPPFNPLPGANNPVYGVAMDGDRAVIVGDFTTVNTTPRNRIARMLGSGQLDTGFNPGQGADDFINAIARDSSGRFLIGGGFNSYDGVARRGIARVLNSGALDATFDPGAGINPGSVAANAIEAIALQADGKVLIGGNFTTVNGQPINRIARLNSNGSVDSSFTPGLGANDRVYSIAVQSDGRIVIGGAFTSVGGVGRSRIARLNSDGTPDTSFDPGFGANDIVFDVKVQTDGRILAAGAFTTMDARPRRGIARLNTNGGIDLTFDPGEGFDDSVFTMLLQADGKILAGGLFTSYNGTRRVGVARLLSSGILDTDFMDTAYNQFAGVIKDTATAGKNSVLALAQQTDGDVIIGGSFFKLGGGGPFSDPLQGTIRSYRHDKHVRRNFARLVGDRYPTPGPGYVELASDTYTIDEGLSFGTSLFVTMHRTNGFLAAFPVLFNTRNEVAVAGADYTVVSSTPTWASAYRAGPNNPPVGTTTPAFNARMISEALFGANNNDLMFLSDGSQSGNINFVRSLNDVFIPILPDPFVEGNENFRLELALPTLTNATPPVVALGGEQIPIGFAVGRKTAVVTITDDDFAYGELKFQSAGFSASENDPVAVITVVRTNGATGSVSVRYSANSLAGGTAMPGLDYETASGTIFFGPGQTVATFTVPLIDDTAVDGNRTVNLTIFNPTGGATLASGGNLATLTILDNDTAGIDAGSPVTSFGTGGGFNGPVFSIAYITNISTSLNGRWMVGGNFSSVDGQTRSNIARLNIDGTLDSTTFTNFTTGANGPVYAVAVHTNSSPTEDALKGRTVVAGSFTQVNSTNRGSIARLNVDGSIDSSFNPGSGANNPIYAVAIYPQGDANAGKILVAGDFTEINGFSRNRVARLHQDGSVDTSFNPGAGANDAVRAVAIDANGRVVIGGYFTNFNGTAAPRVARLNPDGSLDSSFNALGAGPNDSVRGVLVLPAGDPNAGKIVIVGDFTVVNGSAGTTRIARLAPDGAVDPGFSVGTGPNNLVLAAAIDPDGQLIVVGDFTSINGIGANRIARLQADGSLDPGVNFGLGANDFIATVALQQWMAGDPSGKITIGGGFTEFDGVTRNRLVQLQGGTNFGVGSFDFSRANFTVSESGTLATVTVRRFGGLNSQVSVDYANTPGTAVRFPDNPFITSDYTNFSGTLTFQAAEPFLAFTAGIIDNNVTNINKTINLQLSNPQGGATVLSRFVGAVDATFNPLGVGANGQIRAAVAQPWDGKIVIVGDFTSINGVSRNYVARLNEDGTLDATFDVGIGANLPVLAVALHTTGAHAGKVVIGGAFTSVNGVARNRLARLNPNGSVDTTAFTNFGTGVNNGQVNAAAIDTGGNIFLGGNFTSVQGVNVGRFARLQPDGALDAAFHATFGLTGFDSTVRAIALDAGGNIHVGGDFTTYNGATTRNGVARFDASGSLDAAFNPNVTAPTLVRALALDASGRLLIGGDFTSVSATARNGLARVDAAGVLDGGFDPNVTGLTEVRAIRVDSAGRVLIGGNFTQVSGQPRANYARLNADGTLDTAFVAGNGADSPVNTLAEQPGGRIFVGGSFTSVNGTTLGRMARLQPGATLTILDDDSVIRLASANFSVNENVVGSNAVITVVREGGTAGTVTVNFSVSDGTATGGNSVAPGVDYLFRSGTLTFTNGQGSATFLVPIVDDTASEGNETVMITLFNPTGPASLGQSSGVLTIVENDFSAGTFQFSSATYSVSEGGGTATITVVRTNGSSGIATVRFATSNGTALSYPGSGPTTGYDYTNSSGVLTFGDGVVSRTFTIGIIDDIPSVTESDETVNVTLLNPTGGAGLGNPSGAVLTIRDDDFPGGTLSFDPAAYTVSENGGMVTISVTRNGGSGAVGVTASTVDGTARAGTDYTAVTTNLSWAAGDLSTKTFDVPILDQAMRTNVNRMFTLVLSNPTGGAGIGQGAATVEIQDNETGPGVLSFSGVNFSASEDGTNAVVTVVRTSGTNTTVQVDVQITGGTAVAYPGAGPTTGYDFTNNLPVTLTFAAGVATQQVAIGIIDNLTVDGNRTINLALANPQPPGGFPVGGPELGLAAATVTIIDNEFAGIVDTSFAPSSGPDGPVLALALHQSTGNLVIGGEFTTVDGLSRNRIARLLLDGSVDTAFRPGTGANNQVLTVSVEEGSGRVYLGGAFLAVDGTNRNRIARLNADGSLDQTFSNALANNVVYSLAVQADGKVVVGGLFTSLSGGTRNFVGRVNANGSLDTAFNPGAGPNGLVRAVAVQPDGKVLIGGDFTTVNGVGRSRIARLNADGTLDTSFDPGAGANNSVFAVSLLVDGRIVIGGSFDSVGGVNFVRVARLNANGTPDSANFPNAIGTGPDNFVASLAVQPDGKILIGGAFLNVGGVRRPYLARLRTDGALDPAINFGTGPNDVVNAVALQSSNGKIVIGGAFTAVDGAPRNRVARLTGGDNPGAGSLEFSTTAYQVSETATNAFIEVVRRGGLAGTISVVYTNTPITAVPYPGSGPTTGYDYTNTPAPPNNALIIPENVTRTNFLVGIIDNTVTNADRTLLLELRNPALAGSTVNLVPSGAVYDSGGVLVLSTQPLRTYEFIPGANDVRLTNGTEVLSAGGVFVAQGSSVTLFGAANQAVTAVVRLPLTSPTLGARDTALLTILDNDSIISFTVTNFSVVENSGTASISVSRAGGTASQVSVDFNTANGTAVAGVDYVATSGTLVFQPGQMATNFNVVILDNFVTNLNKTVFLRLSNVSGNATLGESNAVLAIIDNEFGPGIFSFSTNLFRVEEEYVDGSGTNAVVTVLRSGGSGQVSVQLITSNAPPAAGVAAAGADYAGVTNTLVFADGETSKSVLIAVIPDSAPEGNEVFSVVLASPTGGAAVGSPNLSTVEIIDNDSAISFVTAGAFTVPETNRFTQVAVRRTGGTNSTVSVNFTTQDGGAVPATAGSDYTATSGTLTWGPGVIVDRFIQIPITHDLFIEGQEDFEVLLTVASANPPNVATIIAGANPLPITIVDDDLTGGALDTTFVPSGVDTNVNALAVQSDGKIVVAGGFTGFGQVTPGIVSTTNQFALSPTNLWNLSSGVTITTNSGVISTAGSSINGLFDGAFTSPVAVGETNNTIFSDGRPAGTVHFVEWQTPALVTVSRIRLIAGHDPGAQRAFSNVTFHVFNASSGTFQPFLTFDTSNPYGGPPTGATLWLDAVLSASVTGNRFRAEFVQLNNGAFDGPRILEMEAFAPQSAGGQNRILRLDRDGALDGTFLGGTRANDIIHSLALDMNTNPSLAANVGKIVIGGLFTQYNGVAANHVARLNTDGNRDAGFDTSVGANNAVTAVAVQPDGKVVFGGSFTSVRGTTRNFVARLNADGSLDTGFMATGSGPNAPVSSLLVDPFGKIYIGGEFTSVHGQARRGVARLNGDGSLDATFLDPGLIPGAGTDGPVLALAAYTGNRILIGGQFTTVNGVSRAYLALLDAAGQLDPDFLRTPAVSGPNDFVSAIVVQPDEKILVGGGFTSFNGIERNRIARLAALANDATGILDVTINFGAGFNDFVSAIAVQPLDGKIVVGGAFTSYDGMPRNHLVRLEAGLNTGPGLFENGLFEFSAANYSVDENAGPVVLTVNRRGGLAGTATVQYADVELVPAPDAALRYPGSGPTSGYNYTNATGTLAFAPGQARTNILVGIIDNTTTNVAKRFQVDLTGPTGGAQVGGVSTAEVRIIDNENAVGFDLADFVVIENGGPALISVSRAGTVASTVSVDFRVLPGTAASPADFLTTNGTLTFGPGVTNVTFPIAIQDDFLVEGDETVSLLLTNGQPSNTVFLARSNATLRIVDNEFSTGTLVFSASNFDVNEETSAMVTVLRTNGAIGPVSVQYATSDGTATNGVHYASASGTLNWANGDSSPRTFTVPTLVDNNVNSPRAFSVRLFGPGGGASVGSLSNATVTILDNDTGLQFSSPTYTVLENGGAALITVVRPDALAGTVTVNFSTGGTSATAGADYTATSGTLTFGPGVTSQTFLVPITPDTETETNETVVLTLSSPTGGARVSPSLGTAVLTILDIEAGSVDLTFEPSVGANDSVLAMKTLGDGSAVIGGKFTLINGTSRNRIGRLLPDGTLDLSFNPGTGADDTVRAVLVQRDGRVVFGGDFSVVAGVSNVNHVARLLANGVLDASFNIGSGANAPVHALDSRFVTNVVFNPFLGTFVTNVVEQLVVAGEFTAFNGVAAGRVVLLNTNGSVDLSFSAGAGADGVIRTVGVQGDGKVIIGGDFNTVQGAGRRFVARLNADGTLDPTFNAGPEINGRVRTIAIQEDGKIVMGGDFTAVGPAARNRVARLNSDGSLDFGFNPGAGADGAVNAVTVDRNNSILVGGGFTSINSVSRNRIARLSNDGSLDTSFDVGTGANDAVHTVSVPPVPVATTTNINLSSSGGQAEERFVIDTGATSGVLTITYDFLGVPDTLNVYYPPQTNGGALIFTTGLTNGSATVTIPFGPGPSTLVEIVMNEGSGQFGTAWFLFAQLTTGTGPAIQDIYIGGDFSQVNGFSKNRFAKLFSDGSVDVNYNSGAGAADTVNAVVLDSAEQIVVAGDFALFNGVTVNGITRLNPDGSLENSFNPGAGASASVRALAVQPDDKAVIGGFFTNYNGTNINRIARVLTNGLIDLTFNPGSGANNPVLALALQTNKVLVGGLFTTMNSQNRSFLARLNPDGALDPSFVVGAGPDGAVHVIAVYTNSLAVDPGYATNLGKVIIAGDFTAVNGASRTYVARLNGDGSVDAGFTPPAVDGSVRAVAIDSAGRVVIGGLFANVGGLPRGRVARLNANGSHDTTFLASGAGASEHVSAIAIAADGKIWVGGGFESFSGVSRGHVARLNTDGSVDPTINFGTGANGVVTTIAIQPSDGKVILGGGFTSFNGVSRNRIVRLNAGENTGGGMLEFSSLNYTGTELPGGRSTTVTVIRRGGTTGTVSANFATTDATATKGSDYANATGTLVFPEGESRGTFSVTVLDDQLVPGDPTESANETLTLSLTGVTGGALPGATTNAVLTIIDNDSEVGFALPTFSVSESVSNAVITVTRTGGAVGAVAVDFSVSDGTATNGVDYAGVSGTLVFLDGVTSQTFTVPLLDDTLAENNESVQLTLSNPLGATRLRAGADAATLLIVDDELAPGQLQFATNSFQVNESAGTATLTVVRTNGIRGVVSVAYATSDGSAVTGQDYAPTNGTLSFADGETSKTITIPILSDSQGEGDETFAVTLSNPTGGASLGAPAAASVTILDDDISISFNSVSYTALEGSGSAAIALLRTGGTNAGVAVAFTTVNSGTAQQGVDYLQASGTVVFNPGEILKTFNVPLVDDPDVEGAETLGLSVSSPTGGATLGAVTNATLTILDDDINVRFALTNFTYSENAGQGVVTVQRIGGTNATVTVDFFTSSGSALAGQDFTNTSGTLTFNPGETNKTFAVTLVDDAVVEADESLSLFLTSPSPGAIVTPAGGVPNGPTSATLTITNNDISLSFVTNALSVTETDVNVAVSVIRRGVTNALVAVNFATVTETGAGKATAGSDYTATNGVLTFAPGETNKSFDVRVLDDVAFEGDETVSMILSNATVSTNIHTVTLVAPTNATLTILDTVATLRLSAGSYSVNEGATNLLVTVLRGGVLTNAVSVTLTNTPGTASPGSEYTSVVSNLNFAANETSKTVAIPIIDDSLVEPDKTFTVALVNPVGEATNASPDSATVTIVDDDSRVAFTTGSLSLVENSGGFSLTLTRSGRTDTSVSVGFATVAGSAASADFVATNGTVTFAGGQVSANIQLFLRDDSEVESNETFTVQLQNPSAGLSLGTVSNVTVTIIENDFRAVNPAGFTLTGESFVPASGAVDPGESVTISFGVTNVGNITITNLILTLEGTGGVTTNTAQTAALGQLAPGGAVNRAFTFTASPGGTNLTATLQVRDGTIAMPSVTYTIPVGTTYAFTNATVIAVPSTVVVPASGPAAPYPSAITVSNVPGTVNRLMITLHRIAHTYPDDIDVLLVGPQGQRVVLMSDAGGNLSVSNNPVTLTFDDQAGGTLPDAAMLTTGTYRPTNHLPDDDAFPAPAPAAPYSASLSVFGGTDPNGTWSLFVRDDQGGDNGYILGGWSLQMLSVTTTNPLVNLGVSVTDSPDPVFVTELLSYSVVVTNAGPNTATNVVFTNTLPASAMFVSASASQGGASTNAQGQVAGSLGNLAAGGTATISITVRPQDVGAITNVVVAGANGTDLKSALAVTTVNGPAFSGSSSGYTNGTFGTTLMGRPNRVYVIDVSTDLINWTPVSTNATLDGVIQFIDQNAALFNQRFYRAREQ